MLLLLATLQLVTIARATVPFKERSIKGNYKLKMKSVEAGNTLFDRVAGLQEICTSLTLSMFLHCEGVTKTQSMNLVQQDDLVIYIDVLETIQTHTTHTKYNSHIRKRSVPWNLDRVNQRSGVLDSSYKDEADVNVYVLGSGINVVHSEFENRATVGFSDFENDNDCEGSGTELASLVGGRTVGIARAANLIGVKVLDCDGKATQSSIIKGITYIQNEIHGSTVRSVVLVGFTMDKVYKDINNKLVDLSEVNSGILVIGGAGATDDLNACKTTPASAQGVTGLNGVITVGATDETDSTVSNLGECVDLFAPGVDIPVAAGSGSPTDMATCSSSLCSAALAAGVIANSLRRNSKISLETQKSMLINGATVTNLRMPEKSDINRNDDVSVRRKALLLLKARTPQRILYSSCGYYQNKAPPVCESYTAQCNNSKISTFDGNNVPVYQQREEKCGFIVFQSKENGIEVKGSYHKCTLGAYNLHWKGSNLVLLPGPDFIVNKTKMVREKISYEDNDMTVTHEVDMAAREPLVVVILKKDGKEEIRMEYDGTSRLRITLLNPDKYSGKTNGLCGLFDRDGTNDYLLPDGTNYLTPYTPEFHTSWMTKEDCKSGCYDDVCTCEDVECRSAADTFCNDKFKGASDECLANVNVYKEVQSCIEEVSKCCCQAKQSRTMSDLSEVDLGKICCQNSFFGNFERNRQGCNFCDSPVCVKEETTEKCRDDSLGKSKYDYLDQITYTPVNTCYFIASHDTQICKAPRNRDMMWEHQPPTCQEKTCVRPDIPNAQTLISPDKDVYSCGETVTVTCSTCYQITPSQQVIECKAGTMQKENDANWSEDVQHCERITCPNPTLPDIDDNKNVKYPLSWRMEPFRDNCGDKAEFHCDICYDKVSEEETICQESGEWTNSPRCQLRHCEDPSVPAVEYPLAIKVDNRACNDTVEYHCKTRDEDPVGAECYDLVGDTTNTCHVIDHMIDGTSQITSWSNPRPSCDIRHCEELDEGDLEGEGWYQFSDLDTGGFTRVNLRNDGSNSPTECGSKVQVICEECSYLCGGYVERTCEPNHGWSGGRPQCGVRLCRAPVNDVDGSKAVYSPTHDHYECGDHVTFSCKDECHEYVTGSTEHYCRPNITSNIEAKWEGDSFSCTKKECPALTPPTNGSISNSTTTCGTLTLITCDPCFELVGSSELKCQPNKTWTHEVPRCVMKKCPIPGYPSNGTAVVSSVACGGKVNYTCDECFYMEGEKMATCDTDRSWSYPAPKCKRWTCPAREHPPYGNVNSTTIRECGDSVKYTCNMCYEMSSGEEEAKCLAEEKWSSEQPVCTIKTCGRPDIPANTSIVPDKGSYNCGDFIQVKCDPCYECSESQEVQCVDGGWEREIPACNIKTCQPPGLLRIVRLSGVLEEDEEPPGSVSWPVEEADGFTQKVTGKTEDKAQCGDTLQYECDECYNLRGDNTIHCAQDKKWSPDRPYCEMKVCAPPEELTDHLTVTPVKQNYSCNDTLQYSCDDVCWYLDGPAERNCNPVVGSNFTSWQAGDPPSCSIKMCMSPFLDDELVSYTGEHTCGSTITFSCPSCYQLSGSPTSTCQSDEDWDNLAPTCIPVCCPKLQATRSDDPTYDVATMSFKYLVTGSELQKDTCGQDHVCQKAEVTCEKCYEYHSNDDGQVYSRALTRTCEHPGNWTNEEEVCTRKECRGREPEKSQHIKYVNTTMSGMVHCGDKVNFQCDACHENLDGAMEHECLPTKQWSHPDIPTCTLKECAELPLVHESCSFGVSKHRTCGTTRHLECDECFYTTKCEAGDSKDTALVCNINKDWEWRAELPEVNVKTCDPPPVVEHASFATDGDDYQCGRVIKYECDECYEFKLERECNCAIVTCEGRGSTNCTKGSWEGTFPVCTPKTCSSLEVPANAYPITNNNSCLATFEVECDPGYELVSGDPVRTCQTNQEWSGSPPVCQIRNCTQLQPPADGFVSTMDKHYGTVVTFTCDSCYEFPDSMTDPSVQLRKTYYPRYHILKCEEHGNWNGSEPVCQRKYCGKPDIPGNADITAMEFFCGDSVGYTCNTGYYQSGGNKVRNCGTDSLWDGEDYTCSVKTCEKPKEIKNGDFSPVLNDYVYKSTVTFDCEYCHEAVGRLDITCEDYSKTDSNRFAYWDPEELPKCSRIQCPAVGAGSNTELRAIKQRLNSRDCSQILVAVCDTGYHIRGPQKSIFCQSSGQWTGDAPQCERRCCPALNRLENGLVEQLDDSQCFGDRVKHTCDKCHEMSLGGELVPHSIQTCESDGMWSGELPFCRRIKCPHIRFLKGNYSDSSYSGYCGTTRTFQCYSGYTLKGSNIIHCQENSKWSAPAPTCEPNSCPSAGLDILNGQYISEVMGIVNPTGGPPESITIPLIIIPADGTLESTLGLPPLEDPTDGAPDATTLAQIVSPSFQPLATPSSPPLTEFLPLWTLIYFECNEGYELHGNQDVFCSADGKWSGRSPKCTKEICPNPEIPSHGNATWTHLKEGGIVTYSCDECFRLDGYSTLRCIDGEWFPNQVPTCTENVCYPPGEEENSYILGYDPEKISYKCGDIVEYACDDAHTLHGSRTRICSSQGQWSGNAPVCADVECPPLVSVENGGMKKVNGTNYVDFWCNKGYQMSGDSQLLCVKGQWQGVEPMCTKQVCGDPGTPDWGTKSGSLYDYGSSVSFTCNQGYQMRGARTITCNHKGEWDYSPPYCVCNECPRLSQPSNGFVLTTDSNSYQAMVQYVCNPGYEVVGDSMMECMASGDWSGTPPRCERLNCTENYQVPQGGQVTSQTGHSYQDQIEIKCPGKKGSWWRTCQEDGIWSGTVPERCDCRTEVRKIPVQRHIVKPAMCFLGMCTPKTIKTVTEYDFKEFSVCD